MEDSHTVPRQHPDRTASRHRAPVTPLRRRRKDNETACRPFAPPPATPLGEICRRALEGSVPPRYAGRVVLLRTANGARELDLGWHRVSETPALQALPGDVTCLSTQADALVERLRACLDETQRERAR